MQRTDRRFPLGSDGTAGSGQRLLASLALLDKALELAEAEKKWRSLYGLRADRESE